MISYEISKVNVETNPISNSNTTTLPALYYTKFK